MAMTTDKPTYILASLIVLIGILTNLLVVVAVWKRRSLRSTTNLLLVNLAISDIISLSFLPMSTIQSFSQFDEGPLADFLCKFLISWHIPVTASYASIFTLTVLAVERYHAIVKPMRTGIRLRDDTIKYAILCIWLIAVIVSSPFYIFGHFENNHCIFDKTTASSKLYYVLFCAVFIIFGPFFLILYCYIEVAREFFNNKVSPTNIVAAHEATQKRKLVRIAFLVTLAYMFCFFPVIITYGLSRMGHSSAYFKVAVVLYFLEPVFNPLLYSFQSSNFRQVFKEILKCKSGQVGAV